MASTLVYTSTAALSARREAARVAAEARREAAYVARQAAARRELMRRLPGVVAMVREEGEWFNVKISDSYAKYRGQGWSAESVARALLDPDTDIEYWPAGE